MLCHDFDGVWRVGVMTSGIIIRSAALEDFDRVGDLYRRSVSSNPKGFIQDLSFHGCVIQKMPRWREAGGDLLVAIADGQLVGLGGLAPQEGGRAELCKLHVDSRWQGRGIGRLLATGLICHANKGGFSEVELHVTATQTAAISLYRRLGFREVGRNTFTASVFGEPVLFDTIYMLLAVTLESSAVSAATSRWLETRNFS
jgi:ribosomal protein S18 acetylase RimI-like enzyme